MTYGVILARFQPVHNGHLALIKKAVPEIEFKGIEVIAVSPIVVSL